MVGEEHRDDKGICVVCWGAWPCDYALKDARIEVFEREMLAICKVAKELPAYGNLRKVGQMHAIAKRALAGEVK